MAETVAVGDAVTWPLTRVHNHATGDTIEADELDDDYNRLLNAANVLKVLTNNVFLQAKNAAGTAYNIMGVNASDVFTLGNASLATNILGSTVQANGVDIVTATGTQTLTNKTLTSPKIGTSVLDTNGNELVILTATASAVNEVTLANAATGSAPTLTASGGDLNIDFNLIPKGTGVVKLNSVGIDLTAPVAEDLLRYNGTKWARFAKGADNTALVMVAGAIAYAAIANSVFGRTGAVVATSGDYTAAQVTNAADKSAAGAQTFTGNVQAPALIASGLTGATAASRYVGATASGAPGSGTFAVGDYVIDQTGKVFVCTTAGTPGTWTQVGSADFKGARVYKSANQSIANVSWTSLTFDTESFDTDTMHDNATNNERLTITTAGKYLVGAHMYWAVNATGYRDMRLVQNVGTYLEYRTIDGDAGNNQALSVQMVTIVDLSATDYLRLEVFQDSGGALNAIGTSQYQTNFWAYKVG